MKVNEIAEIAPWHHLCAVIYKENDCNKYKIMIITGKDENSFSNRAHVREAIIESNETRDIIPWEQGVDVTITLTFEVEDRLRNWLAPYNLRIEDLADAISIFCMDNNNKTAIHKWFDIVLNNVSKTYLNDNTGGDIGE